MIFSRVLIGAFILVIMLSYLTACGQKQNEIKMKATVQQLIHFLQTCDSISVIGLFERDKEKKVRSNDIKSDCNFFKEVTKKYGAPTVDSFILSQAENGANIISVTLMNQKDTLLKIKKCDLVVIFYPDQFLSNPGRFLYYAIISERLHPLKNTIFERPIIRPKKS